MRRIRHWFGAALLLALVLWPGLERSRHYRTQTGPAIAFLGVARYNFLNKKVVSAAVVKTFTIDHTQCGTADSTNFPVKVSGTYPWAKDVAHGGSVLGTYDLVFYSDAGCTTKLNFERSIHNQTTGDVVFYVQIPTLTHSTDLVFYARVGNAAITTDQQSMAATWDASIYFRVCHCADNAASTVVLDSTGNGNGVSARNTSAMSAAGKWGLGFALDGSSDWINFTGTTGNTPALTGQFSIMNLFKTATSSTAQGLVGKSNSGVTGLEMSMTVHAGDLKFPSYTAASYTGNPVTDNTWRLAVMQQTGVGAQDLYVNGTVDANHGSVVLAATLGTWHFGRYFDDVNNYYFGGSMQEVRIEYGNRSQSWRTAEANNLVNSPGTFYAVT